MKKIYSLLFICIGAIVQAQTPIPNPGFEQWTSANYENPQNYGKSSNLDSYFRNQAPFNCEKSTDAFHGTYALKLTTVVGATGDTSMGYVTNCNPNGNNPCAWKGGMPYNQKPTGFKGHYKSNVVTGDSAGMLVVFKKAGVCLGTYMYRFGGVHSSYIPFSFNFSPALAVTPDTVLFAAVSSDIFNNIQKPGSMIQLDSLAFTGVGSQPALFNGDFETWQTSTIKSPNTWYMDTDDQGNGIYQSTDARSGTYAMGLKTYLGDNNNKPVARGGGVSTGYDVCPKNGNGPCINKGGYPYSNTKDTLTFYYKYVPMGNDSASVYLIFKKNGSTIFSTGKSIHAASIYTYMEVPFNPSMAPDTIIVQFHSSNWNDTSLSYIGSDLKIDDLRFKSQPINTGIKNISSEKSFSVFPNPSLDGVFQINNVGINDVITAYNVLGEAVNTSVTRDKNSTLVQLPLNAKGVYFIQINSEGKIITEKVVVQ